MSQRATLWSVLIIVFAVTSDQYIKFLVESGMDYNQQIDLLPFLALYRTHNEGIAFSMLSWLHDGGLIAMTVAVIGFVSYLWWTTAPERVISRIGFALIIGGALGNLIDRSLLGYVVDYILFHLPSWSFAVFNMADVYISTGAGLIILDELVQWRKSRSAG
ncbi:MULTISPECIES: signal peptidase II [Brucellaceae]|uniref:Lipoprotein signal peptidase n=1 Tax=Pseudochrobactrum saccharolyticum TaxID=354352 RepID=A0A7W8EM84_9HYPH|nr:MULTISPECIES: signal peptidase II [Brucellaceae]KAB0540626.1 signal peptidase II [Pseudochrobactrum saccharolyticum]MBB5090195.1 signal peptidase II [Pseudochrobactrum saccharolyticum]MBX8824367.1 signal peptidase II [Ochrobactrum sp. SFR4]MDP8252098.1 signal peptidase II [Pseudochrobactrum saccharolyticum]UCA45819.1 signal peptidase II [Pseudochrobactrum sp. XF203]